MNIFRILGDLSHALSKCILLISMHRNSSAEGVSLITQALYLLVFITRYLDLFDNLAHFSNYVWNVLFKTFYLSSSVYIIFVMLRVFARTRERETAWKFGAACLVGSAVLTPVVKGILARGYWGFGELMWTFSQILESVAVLPQLLLLRQTAVPTVIDSYYLLALGSYRTLYIFNWILREIDINDRGLNPISVVFGVIQTAFYVDFFWVYYARQRVKLRRGGIVDQDDIRNGWLLRRVFGNKHIIGTDDDESDLDDEENVAGLNGNGAGRQSRPRGRWGSRGISVSADDGVLDADEQRDVFSHFEGQEDGVMDTALDEGDRDAKLRDPDEVAKVLDEEDEDDEEVGSSSGAKGKAKTISDAVEKDDGWND